MTIPSDPPYHVPPRSAQQQESGHYQKVVVEHHPNTGDWGTKTQNAVIGAARRINGEGGREKNSDDVNAGQNEVLIPKKAFIRRCVHVHDSNRVAVCDDDLPDQAISLKTPAGRVLSVMGILHQSSELRPARSLLYRAFP
jgi:hypothetical protein